MQRAERWRALLDLVATGRVEIDDAAARLGVSPATVRRDLDELARQQLLVRTRGGAVAHTVSYDLPMRYRESRHLDEKRAIAAAAAARIAAGSVVGLNGGTTTTEVGRALAARSDADGEDDGARLTVVTNAVNIAHELAVRPAVKIVLTGGVVRPQSYELVGPLAVPVLERVRLDVALLGVDGVSIDGGATTGDEGEAAVNEAMARRAEQVIVVADASKLGRTAFARICGIDQIDVVVTGSHADPSVVAALRDASVDVELV